MYNWALIEWSMIFSMASCNVVMSCYCVCVPYILCHSMIDPMVPNTTLYGMITSKWYFCFSVIDPHVWFRYNSEIWLAEICWLTMSRVHPPQHIIHILAMLMYNMPSYTYWLETILKGRKSYRSIWPFFLSSNNCMSI